MSGNYGYQDGTLVQVISATDTALGQMRAVNQAVTGLAAQLPMVNNSTSGVRLSGLLGDWTTDYQKIVGELEGLNSKASGLLTVNRNVEGDTSGAAK